MIPAEIDVQAMDSESGTDMRAIELLNAIKSAVQQKRSKRSFKLPNIKINKHRPRLIIKGNNNWHQQSMYSEDEGNFPDNIIETVARANTIATDHAQVLPEIRAAPCQIYTKRQENGRALNTDIPSPRRQKHSQLTHQANNTSSQQTQGDDKTINVRLPEQFSTKPPPILPKKMSSKEFVKTWLVHGSDPQGNNHFPEIIPNPIKTRKSKSKSKSRIAKASIVD
ncbi:uncharacterized protein LOC127874494 isoform X1 [Dreissena polymorpha]|uniref:uncharacterized protein LOC127874494 isoform X1 n=1 Tax=Dreissena polymorpha TaxID=45954 RepID=UPI002263F2DC|nr:uncharacterized protein LOC127874494 isoform X1 [Dreissena polymorpha]